MGDEDFNFDGTLKFLKAKWPIIVLGLILIFGFYLRSYHADYPVIGYHNMKEAHTLGEAWFMYEDGDYFVNRLFYNINLDNPEGEHVDNFPLLSWIIVLGWKLFGVKLIVARTVMILFSIGVILFTYLIIKQLFKKEDFALLSAFFVSICPLLIFFGRNVQYDIPALFFMMVSIYFFLKWIEKDNYKNFILFSLFFTIGGLTKQPALILLIPIISIFPFKKLNFKSKEFKKHYWKQYLYGLGGIIITFLFIKYSNYFNNLHSFHLGIKPFASETLSTLLTSNFWKIIYTYAITDNFTKLGFILALVGFVLIILKIKKWNFRFLSFWFFSYLIYAAFAPPQMTGHSYYQIPYAPIIMISVAYALLFIFNSIFSFIKEKNVKTAIVFIAIIILLIPWFQHLKLSTTRQFDTQFFGLDVAGEYINQHSLPDEVIFESGHQDRGLGWHAKRRLIEFGTVEDLKKGEEELNVKWVFVYQWGFSQILGNQEFKDHIYNSYSLVQIGFINNGPQIQPYYYLFQKGGSFNESQINSMIQNKIPQTKNYDLTNGNVIFNYINLK